jgi:hypothetical protein
MQMPVWLSKCTGPAQNLQITRNRAPYRDRMLVKRVIAGAVAVLYAALTLAGFAVTGERPKPLRLRRLLASFATLAVAFAAYSAVLLFAY